MNFIIQCEDVKQQGQVLQHLENEGYRWNLSIEPTKFIPLTVESRANLIVTTPDMRLGVAYLDDREQLKKIPEDSYTYVTGREYLGKKVIL